MATHNQGGCMVFIDSLAENIPSISFYNLCKKHIYLHSTGIVQKEHLAYANPLQVN